MMTGHAPASFASHIQWYGHTAKDTPAIKSALFKTMATHLRATHKQYTALARNHQLQPEERRRPPRKQPVPRPPRPPKPPAPPKPPKPPKPVKPIATKAPPRPPTPKLIHPVTRSRGAQKRPRCVGCNLFICPCSPLVGSPPLSHAAAPAAAADEGDDPETLRSIQMAQCATAMLVAPRTAVTVAHPPSPPNSSLFLTIRPPLFPLLYPLIYHPPLPSLPPRSHRRTIMWCEQNRGAGVRTCSVVAQCCPRDAGGASRRWQR
jgi:outer membrane biosynthesis protein TonB